MKYFPFDLQNKTMVSAAVHPCALTLQVTLAASNLGGMPQCS